MRIKVTKAISMLDDDVADDCRTLQMCKDRKGSPTTCVFMNLSSISGVEELFAVV